MATAAKKEPSVQEVRNIGLEDRLDKVISLIEAQNKAWQKCLTLLTEMNTLLFEKYKSQDILLEKHPPVKAPPPATVGGAPQPQPFNNYSDSIPYGTELESEREAPPESFPAGQGPPPATYNDEPEPEPEPAPAAAPENSAEGVHREPTMRVTPGPPVSSKAELLERVEKVS